MFNSSRLIKNTRLNKLYKQTVIHPEHSGEAWEINFSAETLWNGHQVKFITLTDSYRQSVLAIEATEPMVSMEDQLVKMLKHLRKTKKLPAILVYDHSSFISLGLDLFCRQNNMKQVYLFSGHAAGKNYLARLSYRKNRELIFSFNRKIFNPGL